MICAVKANLRKGSGHVHKAGDSYCFDYVDADVEGLVAPDRLRESMTASIKAALVTSRVSLSTSSAGVDPYNSRLGRRPGAIWNGQRR
jgi:hypothetical protein